MTKNAPVYTARIYGPYTTPVHSHNSLQRIYAMNNVIFNSLVRCVYYMHNRQLFAIMSKITRKKKLSLLLAITARRAAQGAERCHHVGSGSGCVVEENVVSVPS